jgi:hypothetical protein
LKENELKNKDSKKKKPLAKPKSKPTPKPKELTSSKLKRLLELLLKLMKVNLIAQIHSRLL